MVHAGSVPQKAGSPSLFIVQHIPEVSGALVPRVLLKRPGETLRILFQPVCVLPVGEQVRSIGQDAGAPYRVRCCDHRRAALFQPLLMDGLLGRIIVPAAGIVEVVPRAQQAALQVRRGGASRLPGKKCIVLHQARVTIFGQCPALRSVQQLGKQVKLRRHQRAVVDERGLVVARRREVGVQTVEPAPGGKLCKPHADEARIPGVQAVPPASGGIVADVLSPGVNGIYHIGAQHRPHQLPAEGKGLARRQHGRRLQRR